MPRPLAALGLLAAGTLAVASAVRAQAAPPRLDDDAYAVFGRRDGIPDAPVLSLQPARDGQLLLATADGARLFDGRRWLPLPSPPALARQTIRAVFDRANGERVFVSSSSIVIQRGREYSTLVSLPPAAQPIYSAVALPLSGGRDEVIVGAAGGVFRLDSAGALVPVPLPVGMPARDAMVATGTDGSDGVLWVGTRGGGVARRAGGIWTRWGEADGLSTLAVEQVALAPRGDTLTAFAATGEGAFALKGNRWVPIGPRVTVTRVLRVRVGARYETWLGTFGGELYRSRNDREWPLVDLAARLRGSRTQVLTSVDHGLGHPTIYAAFRSGTLMRFRIGLAGRVVMPPELVGHPAIALSNATRDDGFWTWLQGQGAVRMPDVRTISTSTEMIGGGDGRAMVHVHATAAGDIPYIAVEGRVYRWSGSTSQLVIDWGLNDYVHVLQSAFGPGRRPGLIAIGNQTATMAYDDGTVTEWSGFPPGVQALLVDSTTSPHQLLVVTVDRRMLRFDGQRWQSVPGSPLPLGGNITAVSMLRQASGECALAVGTRDGLALLRHCGGPPTWRIVQDSVLPALRSDEVSAMTALGRDVLAVATTQGVTVVRLDSTFDRGIKAAYSITDADGLPHPNVMAFGPLDRLGRLWVGTTLGLGFVNTAEVERVRAPVRITAVELRDGRGDPVDDQARIPEASARLDVSATVPTHHREDETQYRFELDGIPVHPTTWTDQSTVSVVGVAAGNHVLRVRARDHDGREADVVERRFTVVRPWWKTGPALLLYIALLTIGVAAWVRSRTLAARKQAREAEANERRIAVSEARFRRLFEDGTDPQILVLDGRIWQLNATADLLLAAPPGTLPSQPIESVFPGLLARLDVDGGDGRCELEAVSAGGAIPVEVRRTRIPLEGAVLDHLEVTDLRERRRLEAERAELETQLREAQRLESVGTLAGGVAHDFNNLLTVIHTNAELAAGDVPERSRAAESLRHLLVASHRAREVVRQILTFSRRTRTHRTQVRIDALLSETDSLLRAIVPSTVRIVMQNEAPGAVVDGDATQLQQLLLNLCSNAEYAMRNTSGGMMTVRAVWDVLPLQGATAVRLSVSDTGVGITPEVRSRMFEPFYTTKPVGEGTGLGLSVLHGIVGEHGGIISVMSEPGHGATFDVLLPAHRVDMAPTPAVPALPEAPVQRHRLLLVDDEEAVATAVRRLLQRRGYAVDTVAHGAAALEYLRTHPPVDLILTDQTMPVMTGLELIERLRGSGVTTPVILASGFGAAIDRAGLEAFTDVWWMDKPFSSEELLGLVARALSGE